MKRRSSVPKRKIKDRKQEFIKLVASGIAPYKACIEAGYSEKYANTYSHKLLEKYKEEINELKAVAKKKIEEEFSYTAYDSFKKLQEYQEIAMNCFDRNGNPDVKTAIKAEELKGKLMGAYEKDNEQRTASFEVVINREKVDVQGQD